MPRPRLALVAVLGCLLGCRGGPARQAGAHIPPPNPPLPPPTPAAGLNPAARPEPPPEPAGPRVTTTTARPGSARGLGVAVEVPAVAPAGGSVVVSVAVTNPGDTPLTGVTAWVVPDDGLTNPAGDGPAEAAVGDVPPGETRRATVRLAAAEAGRHRLTATVRADGGRGAAADGVVEVRRAALSAEVVGPGRVGVGEAGAWEVRVGNPGDVPLTGVTARATLPPGFAADGPTEWAVGPLAPGEKRTVRLPATAGRESARGAIRVLAVAGGGAAARATAELPVEAAGRPALAVEVVGPAKAVRVGEEAVVRVVVRNAGTGPARGATLSASGTGGLRATGGAGPHAEPGAAAGGRVVFPPFELPAGGVGEYEVRVEGVTAGPARVRAELTADHLPAAVRDEQTARVAGGGR